MKRVLLIICMFQSLVMFAQNKDEISVLANVRSLHKAVFVDKDSVVLENLFAESLSYGHSGGKLENKQEAIHNISRNQSVYDDLTMGPVSVWMKDRTVITRHVMTANEKTRDGKVNALKLHILLVWTKEKKGWKLLARQAVKLT